MSTRNREGGWFSLVAFLFVARLDAAPAIQLVRQIAQHGAPLAVADFDGDGRLDFAASAVTSAGGMTNALFFNRGDLTFERRGLPEMDFVFGAVGLGNLGRDGDLDLALMGAEDSRAVTRMFRNRSGDGFDAVEPALPGTANGTLDWGDFDRDGLPDLLIVGSGLGPESWLLYGNVDGTRFDLVQLPQLGREARGAKWADYDGDGWLDFVLSASSNVGPRLTLHHNEGGSTFQETETGLAISPRDLGWGDWNNDGDLDLLLVGQIEPIEYVTRLYRNDIGAMNAAPEPPSNLQAEFDGPIIRLRWGLAKDANQTAMLSYNVRVGTAPGRDDVVGAMARTDGWRLLRHQATLDSPATNWWQG